MKIDLKNVAKLNVIYILIEFFIFLFAALGFFSFFVRKCSGLDFGCEYETIFYIQGVVNLSFVIYARQKFKQQSFADRVSNLFLASIIPISIINFMIYEFTYSKLRIFTLLIVNMLIILLLVILSLRIHFKKKFRGK